MPFGVRDPLGHPLRGENLSRGLVNKTGDAGRIALRSSFTLESLSNILGHHLKQVRAQEIVYGFLDDRLVPGGYATLSVYVFRRGQFQDTQSDVRVYDRSGRVSAHCGDFVIAAWNGSEYDVINAICVVDTPHDCPSPAAGTSTDCGAALPPTIRGVLYNQSGCPGLEMTVFNLTQSGNSWAGSVDALGAGTISLTLTCSADGQWQLHYSFDSIAYPCVATPTSGTVEATAATSSPFDAWFDISFTTSGCGWCTDGEQTITIHLSAVPSPRTCGEGESVDCTQVLFRVSAVPNVTSSCKWVWGQVLYTTCNCTMASSLIKVYDRAGCFFNVPPELLIDRRGFASYMTINPNAYGDLDPDECVDDETLTLYGFQEHPCCSGCCWIVTSFCTYDPCQTTIRV